MPRTVMTKKYENGKFVEELKISTSNPIGEMIYNSAEYVEAKFGNITYRWEKA